MEIEKIIPYYKSKNIVLRDLFWARLRIAISLARQKLVSFEGAKVLDVGCGRGIFLKLLEEKFPNIDTFGIDIESNVAETKSFLRGEIKIADVKESDFAENFFDIIFCLDVLEHIQDIRKVTDELKRILKKDGLLIVSLPTESFFYKFCRFLVAGTTSMKTAPCSPHFYGAKELERFLIENGLTVKERKFLPLGSFLCLFRITKFGLSNND